MPKLRYLIGYVDLKSDLAEIHKAIKTRTEIRKAEKSGVTVSVARGGLDPRLAEGCKKILRSLLVREFVPYSDSFDALLQDEENMVFVATRNGEVASFILVMPTTRNAFFESKKAAFLGLSGTADDQKAYCPNYLLIWQAITFLKDEGYEYFNLGLLHYLDAPDADVERVAFFKRKWNIIERTEEEECSLVKYCYYRWLKRYRLVRRAVYSIKGFFERK